MTPEDPRVDRESCGGNAAPYVLGALTESEHEAFRVHLQTCAVCREEVAALQQVAAALPAAAPRVRAPAELRLRVMESVHEDARQREALAAPRPSRTPGVAATRRRPALAAGAVALAAILVVLVVSTVGGGGSSARVIRAQVSVPGASASLGVSGGRAELRIAGMPQSPPGHIYEVWVKRSGPAQPTDALFTVTARGAATVGVPGSVNGVRAVMVTSEPLGGSRAPTSAPVILASLG